MAEEKTPAAPDAILDAIEHEAMGMTPPPQSEPEQPESQPVPPRQEFPEEAFDATHDMIVGAVKMGMVKYPNGDKAAAVWDSPLFKQAVIPVLKKYNLTIYNLPVELVLIGTIVYLAKQTADIIREGQANGTAQPQTAG